MPNLTFISFLLKNWRSAEHLVWFVKLTLKQGVFTLKGAFKSFYDYFLLNFYSGSRKCQFLFTVYIIYLNYLAFTSSEKLTKVNYHFRRVIFLLLLLTPFKLICPALEA